MRRHISLALPTRLKRARTALAADREHLIKGVCQQARSFFVGRAGSTGDISATGLTMQRVISSDARTCVEDNASQTAGLSEFLNPRCVEIDHKSSTAACTKM